MTGRPRRHLAKLRPNKGASMASVLLCLSVLVALIFATLSASLSHLSLVTSRTQGEHARNLAESALARAMEQTFTSNFTFGSRPTDRVELSIPGVPDGEGIVTFNRSEFGQGYSSYNLDSDSAVVGAGGTNLPPASIHYVARGRVGDTVRWIECVLHKPPYPDGLVASGRVEASGLQLSGVYRADDYSGGSPNSIPATDQSMANLFSNAVGVASGQPAVLLRQDCVIHGSVGSPGRIQIDPDNTVDGEVQPNSDPRPIPAIDINARINTLAPNTVPVVGGGGGLTLDPKWFNRSDGPLTVNGDLDLNGTALTVNGDLTVNGAIKGIGIILVRGAVTITDGGSMVTSSDQVAIAATGDVTISASNAESNYFQGLVYSEGDFQASDITVVGTVVTNGKNGKNGTVALENVRFVRTPAAVQISVTSNRGFGYGDRSTAVSFTLRPAGDGTYLADVRAAFTIDADADDSQSILDNPRAWDGLGDTPHYLNLTAINVGRPGPDFGRPVAERLARWADPLDDRNGYNKWLSRYMSFIPQELNGMLNETPERYEVFLSLNTLLAEQFGRTRVLIWRPFEP